MSLLPRIRTWHVRRVFFESTFRACALLAMGLALIISATPCVMAAPAKLTPGQKLERAIAKADNDTIRRLIAEKHQTIKGLPLPVVNYFYLLALDDQITNGGFMQFFYNDDFETSKETRQAVQDICGGKCLALYDQAFKAYSQMKPKFDELKKLTDPEKLRKAYCDMGMKNAPANQIEMDSAWYKQEKERQGKIVGYLMAHKTDFLNAVTK